jgi:hypothetical protein
MGSAEVVLEEWELAEFEAALSAFLDLSALTQTPKAPVDEHSRGDHSGVPSAEAVGEYPRGDDSGADPVDDYSRGDRKFDGPDPAEGYIAWRQRRADAFMEIVRVAMAHRDGPQATGADRYLVHAIADVVDIARRGPAEVLGVGPVSASVASQLGCDSAVVTHLANGEEPLSLGRRTRVWNTAQRRAITIRDGGHCRFPGCMRRRGDIHHLVYWTDGGRTDVSNGAFICSRHHTLLHKGFTVVGNPNEELAFFRPNGHLIDVTRPASRPDRLPLAG